MKKEILFSMAFCVLLSACEDSTLSNSTNKIETQQASQKNSSGDNSPKQPQAITSAVSPPQNSSGQVPEKVISTLPPQAISGSQIAPQVTSVPPPPNTSFPSSATTNITSAAAISSTKSANCNQGKLSSLSNYKGSEGKYKSFSSGGSIYYAGYQQITSKDQDAFAIKTDAQGNVCWNQRLTGENGTSGPDERCTNLTVVKEGSVEYVYLICQTDGGSYTGFIPPKLPPAYQKDYGKGGGPKAAYITKLDAQTGNQIAGTYLRGTLKSNGKTNTISLKQIQATAKYLEVKGDTAYGAPTIDSTKRCNSGSYLARLTLDLSNLIHAECGSGTDTVP
jgi:hypothetical protein